MGKKGGKEEEFTAQNTGVETKNTTERKKKGKDTITAKIQGIRVKEGIIYAVASSSTSLQGH